MKNIIKELILNYIYKYFFLLHAASNGIRVSYIGGNKFEFISKIKPKEIPLSLNNFISKYSINLPL